jgi:hypothetical protein
MDDSTFDILTKSLTVPGSRRRALAAALAGVLGTVGRGATDAKNKPCPPCKKRKQGKCKKKRPDGTACPGGTCQSGTCCRPSCAGKVCGDDGCGGSCGTCGGSTTCQQGQCRCADGRVPCGASATCCTGTDICLSSGACGPCVGVFSTFPSSPDGSTCGSSADCCQADVNGDPAQISCAPDDFQNTVCVQPVGTECISHFDCNTGVGQCCWGGTTPTRCIEPGGSGGCAP